MVPGVRGRCREGAMCSLGERTSNQVRSSLHIAGKSRHPDLEPLLDGIGSIVFEHADFLEDGEHRFGSELQRDQEGRRPRCGG